MKNLLKRKPTSSRISVVSVSVAEGLHNSFFFYYPSLNNLYIIIGNGNMNKIIKYIKKN